MQHRRKSRSAAPVGEVITRCSAAERARAACGQPRTTLRRRAGLRGLEGQRQRPFSDRLEAFDDQLVLAVRSVDLNVPLTDELQAVFRLEGQPLDFAPPHDRRDAGTVVLEREVQMAGGLQPAIRDLAQDRDLREGPFERSLELEGQLAHREDRGGGSLRGRRRRGERGQEPEAVRRERLRRGASAPEAPMAAGLRRRLRARAGESSCEGWTGMTAAALEGTSIYHPAEGPQRRWTRIRTGTRTPNPNSTGGAERDHRPRPRPRPRRRPLRRRDLRRCASTGAGATRKDPSINP